MRNKWAHWIATVGGVGCLPGAPGTWGSLSALVLIFALSSRPVLLTWATAVVFLLGLWASGAVARETKNPDPQQVVIDEVCGMMISILWIPVSGPRLAVGFFLFRLFDILKPPPARALERLSGGYGIMLDDVMAGVYAQVVLRLGMAYAHL